jgi:hypothetical protein
LAVALSNAQTNEAPWVALFNGKDLTGWTIKGPPETNRGKAWVQDGELVVHQTGKTREHTFVCSEGKYGDFILEVDCKIEGDFNSGVLFRCIDTPADRGSKGKQSLDPSCLNGYQLKIDPTSRNWTGGVFDDFEGMALALHAQR